MLVQFSEFEESQLLFPTYHDGERSDWSIVPGEALSPAGIGEGEAACQRLELVNSTGDELRNHFYHLILQVLLLSLALPC